MYDVGVASSDIRFVLNFMKISQTTAQCHNPKESKLTVG
jgi:hypothetical protein